MKNLLTVLVILVLPVLSVSGKSKGTDYIPKPYTWMTQSKNSSESMPCGGHDIGMNVWVENGDLLIYLSRSGFFDENNSLLKAGRLRLHMSDNPFAQDFSQTLNLDEGAIYVKGNGIVVRIWADVIEPKVFLEIKEVRQTYKENKNVRAAHTQPALSLRGRAGREAFLSFESWRYQDRKVTDEASQQFSWKWLNNNSHTTYADSIRATEHQVFFEHHNRKETVFDYTVTREHLDEIKDQLPNPIGDLSFGGILTAPAFYYVGTTEGKYASTDFKAWNFEAKNLENATIEVDLLYNKGPLQTTTQQLSPTTSKKRSAAWWHQYWQRSYIKSTNPEAEKILRNYELFRYMLGCNAYGEWPTKFNGGLFCFDPEYVDTHRKFTPDYRCWGGGTMTAQNQRLVYWPMLKSGDVDMMKSQFDTYLRMLPAAVARTKYYWGHEGACFEEQIENFGLPNPAEYGEHKEGDDYGWMNNKWLEYLYDTSLEFCQMILDANEYYGTDISEYKPLITQCLVFFDQHYQMLAQKRGACSLAEASTLHTDSVLPKGKEKLVIYPGAGAETYKMAYNPSSTIAALHYVLESIDKKHGGLKAWGLDTTYMDRLPDIPLTTIQGKTCIAPAVTWERIQNVESTQLYPVFPWRIYGLGRPDIEIAQNTYQLDPWVQKMRSSRGWKQDNIWAPLLGQLDDAVRLCKEKFADGPYRFPAFWEQGFDWAPDHNRGGSAMIGLQEMLLQEKPDGELMLFPCWPKEWDAEFRLHATGNRIVNASINGGNITTNE